MTDGPSRSERVLNLLAMLLDTRVPVSRSDILGQIVGYPGDNDAGRRAFERDKEMLRSMGVPIRVVLGADRVEQLYTVDPDEYYLPDLGLTDDESAALRVAVNAVALGNGAGQGALLKLGALTGAAGPLIAALPMVPQLATLFDGSRRRCLATFTYRGEKRTIEPWAVVGRRGRWYVVGHDRAREALRTFRADRLGSDVKLGPPGAFAVPDDFRPEEFGDDAPWQIGDEQLSVRVAVDFGHLDEFVGATGPDATVEPLADGGGIVTFDVANRAALRSFVLGFEEHAEVLDPPDLRAEIVAWLERVAGAAS